MLALPRPHPPIDDTHASAAPEASTTAPRQPLRVCHIAYTFYEGDNRVLRYAESLAERGDSVDVIALRAPGLPWRQESKGVQVFRIQRRSDTERHPLAYVTKILWFLMKATVLVSMLQWRRRYDVVHVHNLPDFLVFAAIVPKLFGARVILDIHDIMPELYVDKFGASFDSRTFRILLGVERLCCRFADHVIVANHLWHEKLLKRTVASEKCTPIMNYPDLRLFTPLAREEERRDGKFVMLYPGTLSHLQGLDIAINAFALVSKRMPGAEFHIYGHGGTRPELERLAKQCGVTDTVKFMDGLPICDISKVIASSDVGVVPKRGEGFGNEAFSTKTLEFMACGIPLIVSRTRVDAHYFNDTLVRFFTPGDERDLAQAMLWAYEHRTELRERVDRARQFAIRLSWQERGGEYPRLVDSLVAAPAVALRAAR